MSRGPLTIFGALALMPAPQAIAAPEPSHYMDVALVTETLAPRPGSSLLVGLKMTPRPGWHGYWSNAGDSGLPPTVRWSAPAAIRFGPLQHPAPTLLRVMGLTSYVHAGPHVLIARITVDRALPLGTPLRITADVSFAVCSDRLCVPQRAQLSLQMVAGDGTATADATLLRQSLARQPKALPPGMFDVENGQLTLQVPAAARLDPSRTRFFPDENGFFDASRASALSTAPVRIISPITGDPPKVVTGVISDGAVAFRIRFRRGLLLADAPPARPSGRADTATGLEVSAQAPAARPASSHVRPSRGANTRRHSADERLRVATALLIAAVAALCAMLAIFPWLRHPHRSRDRRTGL